MKYVGKKYNELTRKCQTVSSRRFIAVTYVKSFPMYRDSSVAPAGRRRSPCRRSLMFGFFLQITSKDNIAFLSTLPLVLKLDAMTLVHASPFMPERWIYVTSPIEAEDAFKAFQTSFCFIGHTHISGYLCEDPNVHQFKKDHRYLVNVGSIGQPRDGNPQLSFGVFDTEAWTYKNIRLDYNIQQAADAILEYGLPPVLTRRLFEGF